MDIVLQRKQIRNCSSLVQQSATFTQSHLAPYYKIHL